MDRKNQTFPGIPLKIKLLGDCKQAAPILTNWFYDEWGATNPSFTKGNIRQKLLERMNQHKLPICLVAFINTQPVATASLVERELETHPQYENWLSNVYVKTELRNKGIGSYLIEKTSRKAQQINIKELYLYTRGQEQLYEKLGWEIVERIMLRGRLASIMVRKL
jgi:GNAT superfamily N-acetyltransferase